MQTVLITGCSSGFGLETARYFLERGWRVVATMRNPRENLLPASENLQIVALDVTDPASVRAAVSAAGPVDVLVNNAGIGLIGAVEAIPQESIRELFETNTLGTIAMTQALLPQFRLRRSGTIINVTSSVTLRPLTLLAAYTATKAATEAFSRCLALEVAPFNLRVRIVQPGRAPGTRFGANAMPRMEGMISEPYAELGQQVLSAVRGGGPVTEALAVAEAVWRAATEDSCPMQIPAGDDAVALASEQQ